MKVLKRRWLMAVALILLLAACTSPPEPIEEQPPTDEVAEDVGETMAEEEMADDEMAEADDPEMKEVTEAESEEPAPAPVVDTSRYDEFEIITLLPQDAIPAIDNPTFHSADEADDFYEADELVMGVVFNEDARAYSVPHLSRHEIVNDEVGGVKIAVTW